MSKDHVALLVGGHPFERRNDLFAQRRDAASSWRLKSVILIPTGTERGLRWSAVAKTDAEGQGRSACLSRETVRRLKIWLERAGISEGQLFRRLIGRNQFGGAINPGSVAPIFTRVAQWIGMPERFLKLVSGHSTRVGATQDLAALDIDLAAMSQAGGWKSTHMPLQYAERINVAGWGMAKAAEKAGRDSKALLNSAETTEGDPNRFARPNEPHQE